ncbi:ISL3 family transposase [Ornithinimicrobium faecis]|uniref:ISL3 family transposase n=1 Tax=Ornithinimicrobium faecis TaxID=2934158 RepID=A0ABY4YWT4_9MICO|nr:ISL3 family transposase [Ornithinimicrobium sp. HY1793]USQ81236.1 ISL3 family transposase [Ornithinimicrobium sp. HY1793]
MSQGTQLEVEVQHVDVGANRLLGLDGVAVAHVALEEDRARVVHLATAQEAAAACPKCGVLSTSVKGHAVTRPRDLPYGEDPVHLLWRKRRWRCREAACPRGSFTESLPSIPARSRLTTRLRAACGAGVAEDFKDVQAAARYHGVSWPVAHAAFIDHVSPALAAPLPPVCVLGIDETRRGKIKWAQDVNTGRWQVVADRWLTGIVDAAGTGGLLGHVNGRASAEVIAWLEAQPAPWREGISHVTIDLSASYLTAVTEALPDAVVVADRYHLVQLANQTLTEVRQRATRDVRGRRGRKKDPEWAKRRRLLTGFENLSEESFMKMWNKLVDAGDPGQEILYAYTVKERLRELLALSGTNPDRSVISHRLWLFYDQAAHSRSPEIHRLAATIESWWPAVEAAIITGYSNARSEGYNRLAKHQGRNAFGFRNTANQQRRIRCSCTRQHRRATAKKTELPG